MPPTRLLLVDGTGVIFRAFFAIRSLSTRDGIPTNAVFGFIRMLGQLRDVWNPSHLIVVLDGGRPQRRMDLLPGYKANRPPTPDDLRQQIPLIEEYLTYSGIAWVREAGQEADDVLALLCKEAGSVGEVLVATSDKDMLQLVGGPVRVVSVAGKTKSLDEAGVKAKTGVYPGQIVEWLALIGDSADNIPGVPGVGPKTAAQLLGEYGDLAGVWRHIDDIKRDKLREALTRSRDEVARNVALVRLDTDIDCSLQWHEGVVGQGNRSALLNFFEKLEFDSFARDLREPDLFDM